MVISISKKLWQLSFSDPTLYKAIKKILTWIEDGRHQLIFEFGEEVEDIIESEKYSNYSDTLKAIVTEQYYSEDINEIVVRITQTTQLDSTNKTVFYNGLLITELKNNIEYQYLDVSKVDTYLGQPVYITVENIESDKSFIQAVSKAFKGKELCTEKEVKFLHGGGSTTGQVLLANTIYPVRMICIVDSDRKHPTEVLGDKEKLKDLLSICEDRNLKFLLLEKREIENYLPNEIIKIWLLKENREIEKNHPFFEFNNEQKAFFDVKKGLKREDLNVNEIKDLYNNHIGADLYKGFGRTVWKAFDEVQPLQSCFEENDAELKNMLKTIESLI